MRTFEEIKALLEEAESAAALSAEARDAAAADESAAAAAKDKATSSASTAAEAHQALADAVTAVNSALAEIVAGDLATPPPPDTPALSRRTAPQLSRR